MSPNLSRRKLAGILAGAAAASTMHAQEASQPQTGTEIEAARRRQRASTQAIAQVPLPMTVEPAFQFKA